MKKIDKTHILLENPALFKATLEEFALKPYSLASTNEIIKKSNYNKGSFYYRFANKQELFVALMDYIIVIQIDLYNKEKLKSTIPEKLSDQLFDIFYNLYRLHNENPLFYKTITKHLYDYESSSIIDNECIEPLKYRLFKKINLYKDVKNLDNILILIDNLYQNFPEKILLSKNFGENITNFIKFILSEDSGNAKKSNRINLEIENNELEDNPAYILVENSDFKIPKKYISIFDSFINFKKVKKRLNKLVFTIFYSYEAIIKKIISKSFKDVKYLVNFIRKDIIIQANMNKDFKNLLICSLYYAITETPYIAYDFILQRFSQEENQLFYKHILPIMSKTSKIIVLNTEYKLAFQLKQIHFINSYNEIRILDYSILKEKYQNSLEIEYYKQKTNFNKIISSSEYSNFDFNQFITENKITSIRMINEIDYNALIRNEDLI
ncbi:MAG: TetR/AcrR family transcriptional regulator [Candidatus Izemoplasmatales bacterium]|nr:TetR/AcrR family transcriptional regulator [Candidatus Izemoplasmatales bacterium]